MHAVLSHVLMRHDKARLPASWRLAAAAGASATCSRAERSGEVPRKGSTEMMSVQALNAAGHEAAERKPLYKDMKTVCSFTELANVELTNRIQGNLYADDNYEMRLEFARQQLVRRLPFEQAAPPSLPPRAT